VCDAAEIEASIMEIARGSNGGLIIVGPPSSLGPAQRELILTLAAKRRLPAVYAGVSFVSVGALVSYGTNPTDQYRRAASYVDRILKGEKPADLPVQAPTKYEIVINLKTAKALGIEMPPTLLARANEVIE
jgi:putative ABC transport system substrate-binding protein